MRKFWVVGYSFEPRAVIATSRADALRAAMLEDAGIRRASCDAKRAWGCSLAVRFGFMPNTRFEQDEAPRVYLERGNKWQLVV